MYRIPFDFASHLLNDEAKRTLDQVVVKMKANPTWRFAIAGHTDAQGAPDYNQALSERRAEACKAYLAAVGIAPERLSVLALGASRPAAAGTVAANIVNRRVEFYRQ